MIFGPQRLDPRFRRYLIAAQDIRAMTDEEADYWYSKCAGGSPAERVQRALRVLLSDAQDVER